MGLFKKFNFGLKKTRDSMTGAIDSVLGAFSAIDDDLYEELEEALVMGDVGVTTASRIIAEVQERVRKREAKEPAQVRELMKDVVADFLTGGEEMVLETVPAVILVIGVNGVGKTTTIGKMAAYYKAQGKRVVLGAADTFRAAAIEQLEIWAERAGVELVKHKEGADPAAVVFDTVSAGVARGADLIIIDTAGRLHNKKNLMEELAKIYRVIDRELPYADRESLLVLDATTGQNAVNQAREFKNVAEITGIVLTKLDGTARGGVVLAIKNDLNVPVKFVGVGEQIDDLQPFSPQAFAAGMFETLPEDFNEDAMLTNREAAQDEEAAEKDGGATDPPDVEMVQSCEDARAQSKDASAGAAQTPQDDVARLPDEEQGGEKDRSALQAEEAEEERLDGEVTPPEASPEQGKERKKRFGFFNRHA